jgi:glyoxylase-like metal-dependent hydrolase (beta-lactamase superfamily II)
VELTPNLHAFLWTSSNINNCNTYLLRSPEKNILIDPGLATYFDQVRHGLNQLDLTIEDIDLVICTHGHPDHIDALSLFENAQTLFAMHEADLNLIPEMPPHPSASIDAIQNLLMPDFFLVEGELTVGKIVLKVYHSPGHSPGTVTLHWPAVKALFTGDLIFEGGLGRTDLFGGNGSQLKDSIRRMSNIDAEWMLSGHGDLVSGASAVKANFEMVERMWFGYV